MYHQNYLDYQHEKFNKQMTKIKKADKHNKQTKFEESQTKKVISRSVKLQACSRLKIPS